MSIGHPIPEMWLFQNLTLKIRGQGHGWVEHWKSQSGCNILSIHIPFVPCQSALPFLRYSIFKIWPWKSKVKVKWLWCCTTTRQFHRTQNGINPSSGFRDMGSAKSDPSAASFDKFFGPGASPYGANGQITMTLHNYRSRQVHETLNGVNPSSSFRDMHSAKSGPNLWQIWQVFGPWASPYGANEHMTMIMHTYRPRPLTELRMEKIRQAVTEIWVPQVWQPPVRPPARTVTTIPLQPGGLRGKKEIKHCKDTITTARAIPIFCTITHVSITDYNNHLLKEGKTTGPTHAK